MRVAVRVVKVGHGLGLLTLGGYAVWLCIIACHSCCSKPAVINRTWNYYIMFRKPGNSPNCHMVCDRWNGHS